jgi:hypothetical protein
MENNTTAPTAPAHVGPFETVPAGLAFGSSIAEVIRKGIERRAAEAAERAADPDAWVFETCWKCAGSGRYFGPPEPGVCFACNGHGGEWTRKATIERRERDRARRAERARKEAERRLAERRAKLEAWAAANPTIAGMLLEPKDPFTEDLRDAVERWGSLTPRQTDALKSRVERDAARASRADEVAVPVVEGRGPIEGEVVRIKLQESAYGQSLKMLVVDDRGFKVWGTIPTSIKADVTRGARVRFEATVTAKSGEVGFGFFSRPTKAVIL